MSASKGYRLFFLGGRPGAVRRVAERLKTRHPAIDIVGHYCPPYGFETNHEENQKIVAMIRRARPHLLFVGLGSPKQERWVCQHRDECRVPVAINIGAGFDFAAGLVKRAPLWMQRAGLEWFWRLMLEPRRLWRRYLIDDPKFFWYLALQLCERSGSRGVG
jgi:N-acetylglucosaminyldiphosphoundecaprenol N-acetyl-beta-D-mannosaminyltransferase